MKKGILLLGILCLHWGSHANELWMSNDSPFLLRAQLYGSGDTYAEQTVAPGTQWHWNDDKTMSGPATDPNTGASMYTVIWYCLKSGQAYGTNTNVAAGSWVFAQSSEGQKICPLPKKPSSNQRQKTS